ncbi:unnamed protein product, partial [Coregonus sp. 'balchen']
CSEDISMQYQAAPQDGGSSFDKESCALIVRFLTRRFIGEYASSPVVYDISDRCSFSKAKAIVHLIRELNLGVAKRDADSLVFLVGNKQDLCHVREVRREEGQRLAAESQCQFYELSAAEHYQEVVLMFSKTVHNVSLGGGKAKERRRRPSGSKSMAKLINNVFGKRRKSV